MSRSANVLDVAPGHGASPSGVPHGLPEHGSFGKSIPSSLTAITKDIARRDGDLYWVNCPRCEREVGLPFSIMGGPQVSEHQCGREFSPRRIRYMTAASGVGYIAYAFPPEERVEPRLVLWIAYWFNCIREVMGQYESLRGGERDE